MESAPNIPLAQRMRPNNLAHYLGQDDVVSTFKRFIEQKVVPSFILWGPAGVGKTTLAILVAKALDRPFYQLSAVSSGVKDVRETIDKAQKGRFMNSHPPILFIDEIHRFSKAQQDSLLGAVEQGVITLIGATTENPSFEVIKPLLSRCNVYTLKPLAEKDLLKVLENAIKTDVYLSKLNIVVEQTRVLLNFAAGDARRLLNILDTLVSASGGDVVINDDNVVEALQHNAVRYDKNGEEHYDVISAFIKSLRGSDPNAAIYYLARMIAAGEDPTFIARRLVISACEDVGLANPNALLIANACFETVNKIGMPEGRIPLAQATIYIASSPKSNSAYLAIDKALEYIGKDGYKPVPLHLRNAPTALMKEQGYGVDYKYSHNYKNHFVVQQYLPDDVPAQFWMPADNVNEVKLQIFLSELWNQK